MEERTARESAVSEEGQVEIRVCRAWRRTGTCPFGKLCLFYCPPRDGPLPLANQCGHDHSDLERSPDGEAEGRNSIDHGEASSFTARSSITTSNARTTAPRDSRRTTTASALSEDQRESLSRIDSMEHLASAEIGASDFALDSGTHHSVPVMRKKLRTSKKANTILASANKALAEKLAHLQQLLQQQHGSGDIASMTASESAQWRQAAKEEIEAAHRKQKLAEDSREALRRKLSRYKEKLRSMRQLNSQLVSMEGLVSGEGGAQEPLVALEKERQEHELTRISLGDAMEANAELEMRLQQLEEEKRLYLDEKAESDDKMAKLEFALATAEDLVRAMAQGAGTSEDLLASRLEGAAESASDSDHAEHMAKLHTLINSVAKPESTAPTDKEADTLDILVEKHEELEAAKALLEHENNSLSAALAKEKLFSQKALDQSATFKRALDSAQFQAHEALREWEVVQGEAAELRKQNAALGEQLRRLETVNKSLLTNLPKAQVDQDDEKDSMKEKDASDRMPEGRMTQREIKDLQEKLLVQQGALEEERLRLRLEGEQLVQRSEEMKAAEAAQQRRHTLLTQQEDVIASQTRQLETLSQHLQQVPALPQQTPRSSIAMLADQQHMLQGTLQQLANDEHQQQVLHEEFADLKSHMLKQQAQQKQLQAQLQVQIDQLRQASASGALSLPSDRTAPADGPNDDTVQLAGETGEWAEEVLLMKEISDEMLRAERALSLKLSHKLQDATDMDQEAVEQDLRMSQSLLDTVNVLNEQVMALQDQEQSEVRMLQEMLSDAKTQLEQHAWEKKRMQDEVQWLRSQLSSAFAAGDASAEHLRTRSNVSLDSDAPDEGVARDVTAPRTSVQSLQRERDIGVQSLTAALGKMMTERLREAPMWSSKQNPRVMSAGEGELINALRKLSDSWREAASAGAAMASKEIVDDIVRTSVPALHPKLNMHVALLEEEDRAATQAGGPENAGSMAMEEEIEMLREMNDKLRARLIQASADVKLLDLLRAQKDELSTENIILRLKLDHAYSQLMAFDFGGGSEGKADASCKPPPASLDTGAPDGQLGKPPLPKTRLASLVGEQRQTDGATVASQGTATPRFGPRSPGATSVSLTWGESVRSGGGLDLQTPRAGWEGGAFGSPKGGRWAASAGSRHGSFVSSRFGPDSISGTPRFRSVSPSSENGDGENQSDVQHVREPDLQMLSQQVKELRQQLAAQNAATNADATTPLGFRQAWPRSRQHSVSGSVSQSLVSHGPVRGDYSESREYELGMGRGSILQGQILGNDTPREVNQRLRDEVTEMGVEVKMLRAQVSRLDIEREEIALVCERHALHAQQRDKVAEQACADRDLLQQRVDELSDALAQKQGQLTVLERTVEELEAEKIRLEELLQSKNESQGDSDALIWQKERAEMVAKVAVMAEEQDRLRAQADAMNAERGELETAREASDNRIKRLANSVHSLTSERDALQHELDEATEQLLEITKHSDALQSQLQHMAMPAQQTQPNELDAELSQVRGRLHEKEIECEKQRVALEEQATALSQTRIALEEKDDECQALHAKTHDVVDKMRAAMRAQEEEHALREEEHALLQQEHALVLQEHQRAERAEQDVRQHDQAAATQRQEIEAQLEHALEELGRARVREHELLQELELKERSILVKQRPDRPPQPRVATLSGKLAEDQSSSPSPNPGTPILRSLPASQQNSQQQLLWPVSPGGHDAGPGLPAAPGEATAAGPAEMETARAREMADRERELEADMERERERARLRSEVVADTLAMSLSASISSQIGQEQDAPPAAQAEPTPRAPSLHESPSSLFSANSDLSELLARRKRENEQEVTGQGQDDVVDHPADSFREALGAYDATLTANHGHVSTSQAPITAEEEEKYYQHLLKQEQAALEAALITEKESQSASQPRGECNNAGGQGVQNELQLHPGSSSHNTHVRSDLVVRENGSPDYDTPSSHVSTRLTVEAEIQRLQMQQQHRKGSLDLSHPSLNLSRQATANGAQEGLQASWPSFQGPVGAFQDSSSWNKSHLLTPWRPMDGSTQNNLNHTLNLAPPALEELPPVASLFGVDKQTNRPLHNQLVSPAGNFFEPRRPMGYM